MQEFITSPVFVKVETAAGPRRLNLNQVVSVRTQRRGDGLHAITANTADGSSWEMLGPSAYAFEAVLDRFSVPCEAAPVELAAVPMPVRKPFCETPGANRREYLDCQQVMFKACREGGCDTSQREEMLAAINQYLGVNITSRTQLTPREMRMIAAAVDRHEILPGWHLANDLESLAA